MTPIRIERLLSDIAQKLPDVVQDVYEKSYIDAIASGDPFDSVNAFMDRFKHYVQIPGFDMAVAYSGDEPIGQTWGWPLPVDAGWWTGLLHQPNTTFTHETGNRTFALSEIMVSEIYSGQGVAHQLHDFLLSHRTEERATLLVEPDNVRARRAYIHWGWQPVSQLRPAWDDAPLFDVLVRSLPVT